jgi:tetratricopeptide (TPR) repeat protein
MKRLLVRSSCLTLVALVVLAVPRLALAQEAPARTLFKEGRDLAAKGDHAAACPKFEQSLALESGLGTQFNLADCWEHVGRLAAAHDLFEAGADAAKSAGQPEREKVLRDRAAALAPRIGKVIVQVKPNEGKVTVKRDELEISEERWGKALALDPGSYTIWARSPGRKTYKKVIEVVAGAEPLTVTVPSLEKTTKELEREKAAAAAAAAEAAEKPAEPKPSAKPAAPVQPAPAPDRGIKLDYPVLGLGGLSLASFTFSVVMAARYKKANDYAEGICPTSRNCSRRDIADHDMLVDRASSARTWAFVGLGVGLASAGGATALFVLGQQRRAKSTAFQAVPSVSPDGSWGASFNGSF